MRRLVLTVALTSCALVSFSWGPPAPASTRVSPGPARQATFVQRAAALERLWTADIAAGVAASAIAPLRNQLARSPFTSAPATSSVWLSGDGRALLGSLGAGTALAWTGAITTARQSAESVLAAWNAMLGQYGPSVASSDLAVASSWRSDLAAAATPAAITTLAARWSGILDRARSSAAAAAAWTAILAPFGGIAGLEAAARSAVASATASHLDAGSLPALLAGLEARLSTGGDVVTAVSSVIASVQSLRAVITTYAREGSQLVTLQQRMNQAAALNTAHEAAFPGRYAAVVGSYRSASTSAAVYAVEGRINALGDAVSADLNAAATAAADAARAAQLTSTGCGHAVPLGKVIVVSLSQQAAAFYDNTCLLSTTAVTTGRPGMRTPIGSFRIYSRASPAHFVSSYRPGSPGYYTPETTRFAMAYEGGGYFLHDAPWEPDSAFGAGSQNGPYASHGCIHVPSAVMAWLFSWASMGTRVIVTG